MTEFANIINQLERRKSAIDQALMALREVNGLAPTFTAAEPEPAASPEVRTGNRKKRSPAVRKRMQEAQRLRWAKIRGESAPPPAPTVKTLPAKRRISAEGLKRIVAATKKRWRLVRVKAAADAKAALAKAEAKKVARKKAVAKAPAVKTGNKIAPVKKVAAKKSEPATAPVAAEAAAS